MMPSFRPALALLVLAGLLLSFAEQGWGLVCASHGMEPSAAAASSDLHAGHGEHPGDQGPSDADPPPCPMLAATAACAPVALPVAAERGWAAGPPHAEPLGLSDRVPDLLIGTTLFRPPQA